MPFEGDLHHFKKKKFCIIKTLRFRQSPLECFEVNWSELFTDIEAFNGSESYLIDSLAEPDVISYGERTAGDNGKNLWPAYGWERRLTRVETN